MEKLWTTSEVARFLGIVEDDVEQLVRDGKLTAYKLGGQFLRFRPDQVEGLKGTVALRARAEAVQTVAPRTWVDRLKDAAYFYDFYLISAVLLAGLILYLVAAE